MNHYVKLYKKYTAVEPDVHTGAVYRSVCSAIARYGTIEDLRALNAYYENELEDELNERSTAAV